MFKLIALGIVTFSFAALAENPVPTEKASAEAYALAKLLYTPDQHAQQIEAAVSATLSQLASKPTVKVDTDKLRAAFTKLLNYQDLVDFEAGLLAKYYNSRELAELGAFYATALGKKSLSILPQLTQDAMGYAMQLMASPAAEKLLKGAFSAVTAEPKAVKAK